MSGSAVLSHAHEHRGAPSVISDSKSREPVRTLHPSAIRLKLPDTRRANILRGVSASRYAARLIRAICPGHLSNDARANIIASRTSMSHSTALRLLTERIDSVNVDYILQLAYLLRSQGGNPIAVEGGEVIAQIFGGQS